MIYEKYTVRDIMNNFSHIATHEKIVQFACTCARLALPIYEEKYPYDKIPRQVLEAVEKWTVSPCKSFLRVEKDNYFGNALEKIFWNTMPTKPENTMCIHYAIASIWAAYKSAIDGEGQCAAIEAEAAALYANDSLAAAVNKKAYSYMFQCTRRQIENIFKNIFFTRNCL